MDKFKVGKYYEGTNLNGSIIVFKVIVRYDDKTKVEILRDDDTKDRCFYPPYIIWLHDSTNLINCFSNSKELTDIERLVTLLLWGMIYVRKRMWWNSQVT